MSSAVARQGRQMTGIALPCSSPPTSFAYSYRERVPWAIYPPLGGAGTGLFQAAVGEPRPFCRATEDEAWTSRGGGWGKGSEERATCPGPVLLRSMSERAGARGSHNSPLCPSHPGCIQVESPIHEPVPAPRIAAQAFFGLTRSGRIWYSVSILHPSPFTPRLPCLPRTFSI